MKKILERRQDARTPLKLNFKGITKKSFKDFTLEDISYGGLKLKILDNDIKISINNNLKIIIYYKIKNTYGEENFNISSTIRWTKNKQGTFVGLQFLNKNELSKHKVDNLLNNFNNINKIDCIVE
jgi:c-di-GMP-binding flagellar brake protein YcgR